MKPVIEKWFLDVGFTVRLYEVHCKNTDKDKEFGAFKKDTEDGIKLCLSVNMLAEGIHGDIDGVIMLRETISANMYFQMIGRAFACGKKTIPLIFDLVANSQFISDAANLSFPNELRGEIEKQKKECEKEGKEYEVGFNVDEFIVMDYFMDVVSGFRAIEGRLKGREWTEEEDKIFRNYYPTEGTNIINRLNGRTRAAIQTHASKLGLNFSNPWTEEEIEILKKYFTKIGGMGIIKQKLLPNRQYSSIKTKAYQLGLIYQKGRRYVPNKNDDKVIIENYSSHGKRVLELLPHMTENQVKHRAKQLVLFFNNN